MKKKLLVLFMILSLFLFGCAKSDKIEQVQQIIPEEKAAEPIAPPIADTPIVQEIAADTKTPPIEDIPYVKKQSETPVFNTSTIIITNKFEPNRLVIKKGTTVTFVNKGTAVHRLLGKTDPPDTSKIFKLDRLNPGDSVNYTFETEGNYFVHSVAFTAAQGDIIVTG